MLFLRSVVCVSGLPPLVLNKVHQRRQSCLQQWMAAHNGQELLEPLAPALDIQVVKFVQTEKNLSGKRRDHHPVQFLFQHLPKCDKVAIPTPHGTFPFLESRDVGATDNLVVRILFSTAHMGKGIRYLWLVPFELPKPAKR